MLLGCLFGHTWFCPSLSVFVREPASLYCLLAASIDSGGLFSSRDREPQGIPMDTPDI